MKKSNYLMIFLVLLLSVSLVNAAYATKGWVTESNPKKSSSALNQIGRATICGDHKCAPFEFQNMKKALDNLLIKNTPYFFAKQNATK